MGKGENVKQLSVKSIFLFNIHQWAQKIQQIIYESKNEDGEDLHLAVSQGKKSRIRCSGFPGAQWWRIQLPIEETWIWVLIPKDATEQLSQVSQQ